MRTSGFGPQVLGLSLSPRGLDRRAATGKNWSMGIPVDYLLCCEAAIESNCGIIAHAQKFRIGMRRMAEFQCFNSLYSNIMHV